LARDYHPWWRISPLHRDATSERHINRSLNQVKPPHDWGGFGTSKMSKSKLILLEGIPGSGKTSAGLHLQAFLEQSGFTVQFWREGNFDNPADFEGIACLSESEYRDFLQRYPDLAELFREQLTIKSADYLLKYRKLQTIHPQEIPDALVGELSHYDVYDGLSMDEYCRLALDRWQDFQQTAENSDEITMLECCFLQNPLTVMLARHNAEPQIVREQVRKITEIIQRLNPMAIYLSPQDATGALEHVRAERPKEWADFVTWYLTEQAYGKAHYLSGYYGVIQFYEMRQKMELGILKSLPIHSLVIEHSGDEWEYCDKEIDEFVSSHLD
jgi:hypothetical protein